MRGMQPVGVGIGADYAIQIADRIRFEYADTHAVDASCRRAVRTTGMAVSFTAITIVPALFSVLGKRGMGTVAKLTDEQREALHFQKEMERTKGLID